MPIAASFHKRLLWPGSLPTAGSCRSSANEPHPVDATGRDRVDLAVLGGDKLSPEPPGQDQPGCISESQAATGAPPCCDQCGHLAPEGCVEVLTHLDASAGNGRQHTIRSRL